MRGERLRVTLSFPPSPIFCSVNADKRCCFTVCGGSTPANDRPIEVVGREERGGEGRREEEREERGGKGRKREGEEGSKEREGRREKGGERTGERGEREREGRKGREERGGESHSYSEDMSVLLVADPDKLWE